MRGWSIFAVVGLLLASSWMAVGQNKEKPKWPPSPHVAATEALTPAEQVKKFKLPVGFEIQLVASDPDLRKPINIAFDAAGRLWVTETIEYPFAAKDGKGRDAVKILEDFGPDGRARKITTFADGLNIPIGVLPTAKGALVFSIPAIWSLTDSEGKGKADTREAIYTGFGTQDTHGMTGEFQQGFDGWIYACHGFANKSNVKSKGDTSIAMQSGNTYRIKADGSRVEQWTWGQVNPFGLAFDPMGNLFSADCHSRPLTLLMRGAWYESFSKPHDGLGFAPHMNTFDGHSTALCGVTSYNADQYPKNWQGKLFLGDVVLNRVNAYTLDWTGATPKAVMEPFITSDDPWFRPVDIKLGPDGCLYIADFYNRIIGHYEIALDHPGRDRDKGRIWRVVYRGPDGKGQPRSVANLAKASVKELVASLSSPNLTVRMEATNQIAERGGAEAALLDPLVGKISEKGDADAKVHTLWALHRLGKLDAKTLLAATGAKERAVRVHALQIIAEDKEWNADRLAAVERGLKDVVPFAQRAATEALANHPDAKNLRPLLDMRERVYPGDASMLYAVRLALCTQFRKGVPAPTTLGELSEKDARAIADVSLGVRDRSMQDFLKAYLVKYEDKADRLREFCHHLVRYGDDGSTKWVLDFAAKKYEANRVAQAMLVKAAVQATQERGGALSAADKAAAEKIVEGLLDSEAAREQMAGVELVGMMSLAKSLPKLLTLVADRSINENLRRVSIVAAAKLDAKSAVPALSKLLTDDAEPGAIRELAASALASVNHADAHAALVQSLQHSPARLQSVIALGMASSAGGGERLLLAIEAGKASPQLLQDRDLAVRLDQAKVPQAQPRVKKLTAGLPPSDAKSARLIRTHAASFDGAKADLVAGQKLFEKHCAACHQVASKGSKIGPQLDGIGVRGLERLLEDVLDPSRNVDQAFRSTVIVQENGQIVSGLVLREEGEVVILADAQGKEVRLAKSAIQERNVSPLSPMPSNFAEQVTEGDFRHLLAFLLAQKGVAK